MPIRDPEEKDLKYRKSVMIEKFNHKLTSQRLSVWSYGSVMTVESICPRLHDIQIPRDAECLGHHRQSLHT